MNYNLVDAWYLRIFGFELELAVSFCHIITPCHSMFMYKCSFSCNCLWDISYLKRMWMASIFLMLSVVSSYVISGSWTKSIPITPHSFSIFFNLGSLSNLSFRLTPFMFKESNKSFLRMDLSRTLLLCGSSRFQVFVSMTKPRNVIVCRSWLKKIYGWGLKAQKSQL